MRAFLCGAYDMDVTVELLNNGSYQFGWMFKQ